MISNKPMYDWDRKDWDEYFSNPEIKKGRLIRLEKLIDEQNMYRQDMLQEIDRLEELIKESQEKIKDIKYDLKKFDETYIDEFQLLLPREYRIFKEDEAKEDFKKFMEETKYSSQPTLRDILIMAKDLD